jgi:hypothetical protein
VSAAHRRPGQRGASTLEYLLILVTASLAFVAVQRFGGAALRLAGCQAESVAALARAGCAGGADGEQAGEAKEALVGAAAKPGGAGAAGAGAAKPAPPANGGGAAAPKPPPPPGAPPAADGKNAGSQVLGPVAAAAGAVKPAPMVDPKVKYTPTADLRFSQKTVGGNLGDGTPLSKVIDRMLKHGWDVTKGPPDVVRYPDGRTVSIDNRRIVAAKTAGVPEVPARVHAASDPIPDHEAGRFQLKKKWTDPVSGKSYKPGATPTTWGEAADFRSANQGKEFLKTGGTEMPKIQPAKPDTWKNAATRAYKGTIGRFDPVNPAALGALNIAAPDIAAWLFPQAYENSRYTYRLQGELNARENARRRDEWLKHCRDVLAERKIPWEAIPYDWEMTKPDFDPRTYQPPPPRTEPLRLEMRAAPPPPEPAWYENAWEFATGWIRDATRNSGLPPPTYTDRPKPKPAAPAVDPLAAVREREIRRYANSCTSDRRNCPGPVGDEARRILDGGPGFDLRLLDPKAKGSRDLLEELLRPPKK